VIGSKLSFFRRYSRYFGVDTSAGIELAAYALAHFTDWETAIDNWQHAITTSSIYPDWYKSAIFNELYFLTDGGTFWMEFDDTWPQRELQMSSMSMKHFEEYGRFGYLECK
jgi:non-lysosomal glucosylceramidase